MVESATLYRRSGTNPEAHNSMSRLMLCTVLALTSSACSAFWPSTDIVTNSTEDVGAYDVSATTTTDALTATVCVDLPREDEVIASRIARQLYGKGFRTMQFEMVPSHATGEVEATQITWSGDAGLRVAGRERVNASSLCGVTPR